MIDDANRQYIKLDAAAIETISAMLKAQMSNVPPQQRAMMEQMMGSGFTPPMIEITDGGSSKEVAGYQADLKVVSVNGEKRSESWIVDYDKVEGSREVAVAMKEMSGLLLDFFTSIPMEAAKGTEDIVLLQMFEKLGGFPVVVNAYKNGNPEDTTKLVSIKEETLEGFAPPKGYREQKMGM